MIYLAPSNVTVALGQSPGKFQCNGYGSFVTWIIGADDIISRYDEGVYNKWKEFTFNRGPNNEWPPTITLSIPAVRENNNTQLRCIATGQPQRIISEPVKLTIAGKTVIIIEFLSRSMHLSYNFLCIDFML